MSAEELRKGSSCALPLFVKVRIDLDALRANRATVEEYARSGALGVPELRPIWWLKMPNGREVRAASCTWGALTVSRYSSAGTTWNLSDRVSVWLEVHGPVIADGTLYDPNTEK